MDQDPYEEKDSYVVEVEDDIPERFLVLLGWRSLKHVEYNHNEQIRWFVFYKAAN